MEGTLSMYKKPSKKQLLIRRIIVSTVMTLSVLVTVTGITLFLMGYRIDQEHGRLQQGALVQFVSTPSGATVWVDGRQIGSRTPAKYSLIAGTHTFGVFRDGYRNWAKTIDIKAGTLTWLDDIRLIPSQMTPETVAILPGLGDIMASYDGRIVVIPQDSQPELQLFNTRSQDIVTTELRIPDTLYSESGRDDVVHHFSLVDWDQGNRYVLVKHRFNDQSEWLIIDTQQIASSVNVSRQLQIALSDLSFAGRGLSNLYGVTDGVIRRIDVAAGTISRSLITHVESFALFDNSIITYVGRDPEATDTRLVGVYRSGDDEPTVLRKGVPLEQSLHIATARNFNDTYIAIAQDKTTTLLKGDYPSPAQHETLQNITELPLNGSVTQLRFSANGDYLVTATTAGFTGYELEHQRYDTVEADPFALRWFDNANLWWLQDGVLTIREYDGANQQTLVPASVPFTAIGTDGRYLFTVQQQGDNYLLQRTRLVL